MPIQKCFKTRQYQINSHNFETVTGCSALFHTWKRHADPQRTGASKLQEVRRVDTDETCVSQCELSVCPAVMKSVVLVVLFVSFHSHGFHVEAQRKSPVNHTDLVDVVVNVDLSGVLRTVDERFLSVAVDASLAAEEKFMYLLG